MAIAIDAMQGQDRDKMSNRRQFSLVTFILLLLLIAAIVNFVFVSRAYNNGAIVTTNGTSAPMSGATQIPTPSGAGGGQPRLPDWYGEVSFSKSAQDSYDIVVEAINRGDHLPIAVDAVEADIRHPGAMQGETIGNFNQVSAGKYVAHMNLGNGAWEIRVRIHRGLQTLEFAEKIDL